MIFVFNSVGATISRYIDGYLVFDSDEIFAEDHAIRSHRTFAFHSIVHSIFARTIFIRHARETYAR